MVDLDADEDQSGGNGGDACRPEEVVGVMVMFAPWPFGPLRSLRMSET